MILKSFVAVPDGDDLKYMMVHEARTVINNPELPFLRKLMKAVDGTARDLALIMRDLTFLFDYEFSTVVACDDCGHPVFAVDYDRIHLDDEDRWTVDEMDANLWEVLNA